MVRKNSLTVYRSYKNPCGIQGNCNKVEDCDCPCFLKSAGESKGGGIAFGGDSVDMSLFMEFCWWILKCRNDTEVSEVASSDA